MERCGFDDCKDTISRSCYKRLLEQFRCRPIRPIASIQLGQQQNIAIPRRFLSRDCTIRGFQGTLSSISLRLHVGLERARPLACEKSWHFDFRRTFHGFFVVVVTAHLRNYPSHNHIVNSHAITNAPHLLTPKSHHITAMSYSAQNASSSQTGGAANTGFASTAAFEDTNRPVAYLCGDCDTKVTLKRGDPIRCKECGYRVLYKQRTNR